MCVCLGGQAGDEGQKDLFRFAMEGQDRWWGEGGRGIFLPMMHGSDNVPAQTFPEGHVCVCVCAHGCACNIQSTRIYILLA